MNGVPNRSGSRDGRRVVDGGSGKEAEAVVGQVQQPSQRREDQRSCDVEQEDDGDRLRNLLVARVDHRRGCSDSRTPADGGANTDEHGGVGRNLHHFIQDKRHEQRGRNRRKYDRQGSEPRRNDHRKIHPEAQQDHRELQYFL